MPNPTPAAVRKHPHAVIMLITEKAKPAVVANHDFEWFDTDEGLQDFLPRIDQWARDDFNEVGDLYHTYVTIKDTSVDPLVVKKDQIVTVGEADWAKEMVERIVKDPEGVLFVKPPAKKPAAPRKPVAKAQKVAKGRKPNAAAAVAKGEAPKPKAAQAKAAAAKKAPAKKAAAPAVPAQKGRVDKAAVRKRIEERAEAKAATKAAADAAKSKPSDTDALVNAFIGIGKRRGRKAAQKAVGNHIFDVLQNGGVILLDEVDPR